MSKSKTDNLNELFSKGYCEVVVEIPRGSQNKYEEADDGILWFDRRLGGPAAFPGDYGYVVGSRGEDGDALDALVLLDEGTFPGIHIICRAIGAFRLTVGDIEETKLICVPDSDHHQDHLTTLEDLPSNFREELDTFFESYRMLEAHEVHVLGHHGRDYAIEALLRGVEK